MSTENISLNTETSNLGYGILISRQLVVYDKLDKTFYYVETVWTNEELLFRWDVISEHNTKEEARIACELKNKI